MVFQSLAILAFILACFRKLPAYPLVIALWVGLGASIPFVPRADADVMRVYAATIPLHALIAALGAGALGALVSTTIRKGARAAAESPEALGEMRRDGFAGVASSAVVVVLAFVIPITRYVYFPPTVRNRSFQRVAERPAGIFPRPRYSFNCG